jgi:DNA-binding MarR family transcriptional regulator
MSEPESDAAAVARAVLGLSRRLRAERPEGAIGLSALGALSALNRLGPMPAARLAAEERLQPQSLTRIVADLEQRALIRRRRNPADRRALILEITPIGRHMLASDLRQRQGWLDQAMAARLTLAERGLLRLAAYLMQKLAADPDA